MNCPNCGATIKSGDITCNNCNYPVAMMSGKKVEPMTIQPDNYTYEKQIPSTSLIPNINVKAPVIPKKPKPKNKNPNQYENYGEGKKAITSLKFLIPIMIGVLVLIAICYGVISVIKLTVKEQNALNTAEESLTYKLEFDNFIYDIPNEFSYTKSASTKTLFLTDDTDNITVQVMSATYSSIRSSKASIKGYFQSLGYQVSDIIEETYGISTYLTMTAVKNKTNYIFAITKAGDSSKCFGISIENNTNTLDKTTLERISTVLSNAKYQGKTQEKTVEFNFQDAIK